MPPVSARRSTVLAPPLLHLKISLLLHPSSFFWPLYWLRCSKTNLSLSYSSNSNLFCFCPFVHSSDHSLLSVRLWCWMHFKDYFVASNLYLFLILCIAVLNYSCKRLYLFRADTGGVRSAKSISNTISLTISIFSKFLYKYW